MVTLRSHRSSLNGSLDGPFLDGSGTLSGGNPAELPGPESGRVGVGGR